MSYQLNFHDLVPYLPELGQGLLVTLELTLYATVGGILLGTLGAAARTSRSRPIRLSAGIYVELIRNTPFIVQLFFIFFWLTGDGRKTHCMAGRADCHDRQFRRLQCRDIACRY